MRTFKDTRGKSWFDIIEEMQGQIDVTVNYPGTIRAFHYHDRKYEIFFVISGEYKLVLTDPKEIVYMSQGDKFTIQPGRWHGYQTLKPGIMMEYSSEKFNVQAPDDKKKPYDKYDEWEIEKK